MRHKFISIVGGVMSGLGKGITAVSTDRLLKNVGLDVTVAKIDPCLNVDVGIMNPYEHGKVYVLKDGAEVDLGLGNYEWLPGVDMTADHNITTGKTCQHVVWKKRDGDYLGKTAQIIPHVAEDIKRRIREAAEGTDMCIIEVGGVIGDTESMPSLESLRQFAPEEEDDDVLLTHVMLVSYSKNSKWKMKPTQHSIRKPRGIGFQLDILVGRADDELEPMTKGKIVQFCGAPNTMVFSNPDVPDTYHVSLVAEGEGLDEYVMECLGAADEALPKVEYDNRWREPVTANRTGSVDIALVGKYALEDAYTSIHEALKRVGIEYGVGVNILRIDSDEMLDKYEERLRGIGGVVVPSDFGPHGTDGKTEAIRYARENDVLFLGSYLGFQMAVTEQTRNVLSHEDVHSAELGPGMPYPTVDLLSEQYKISGVDSTVCLGAHGTDIDAGILVEAVYGDTSCAERHRHRYEVNLELIDELESEGPRFSSHTESRTEILELIDHPFFFGTQFHPESRSRPDRANPLLLGFLCVILDEFNARELGNEEVAA